VEVGEVYHLNHRRTNKEPPEVVTAAGKRRARGGRRKGAPEQWRREWGVTLAPTSRTRFYACTAPSPALPPILLTKHHPVPAGEGSSRAADGLVPDGGGEMHGEVQVSGASQGTKHGPPARPRPGWAFGRPHTGNQSRPEVISAQSWVEIPLHGRKYTWSNKQTSPLLQMLDWFFTSTCWTLAYPNTSASALAMNLQTMFHVSFQLVLRSQRQKFFDLKIIGWIMNNSWMLFPMAGQYQLSNMMQQRL
jgi:hypothetical protein